MTTSENALSLCGQIEISQPCHLAIPFASVTGRFKEVCKLYNNVYSSITLNTPKLEMTQMSVSGRMGKSSCIHGMERWAAVRGAEWSYVQQYG